MARLKIALPLLLTSVVLLGASTKASAQDHFIGEIRYVGFNFAPTGWALCDGQSLDIAQNEALFALLGTFYGGDGRTWFALPDMRGRVPVHQGQGPGLSFYDQGQEGGAERVTLSINQMPIHTHALGASGAEASATSPNGNILASKQRVPLYNATFPDIAMSPSAIGIAGGSQPFSIVQPFLGVNCIIALTGIFPSRE
jgi:microcystin-dependent protein